MVDVIEEGWAIPKRIFPFGPKMMPDKMVRKTLEMVADWDYSVVSIGYPGPVLRGRSSSEPYNLGAGWVVTKK